MEGQNYIVINFYLRDETRVLSYEDVYKMKKNLNFMIENHYAYNNQV